MAWRVIMGLSSKQEAKAGELDPDPSPTNINNKLGKSDTDMNYKVLVVTWEPTTSMSREKFSAIGPDYHWLH